MLEKLNYSRRWREAEPQGEGDVFRVSDITDRPADPRDTAALQSVSVHISFSLSVTP